MSLTQADLQAIEDIVKRVVDEGIDDVKQQTAAGFAEVHEKFAEVNERFGEVHKRFAEVHEKLDTLQQTVDRLERVQRAEVERNDRRMWLYRTYTRALQAV